jgi:hypothetical protein
VPLMVGTVAQEAQLFIYEISSNPITESEYLAIAAYLFQLSTVAVRAPAPYQCLLTLYA